MLLSELRGYPNSILHIIIHIIIIIYYLLLYIQPYPHYINTVEYLRVPVFVPVLYVLKMLVPYCGRALDR